MYFSVVCPSGCTFLVVGQEQSTIGQLIEHAVLAHETLYPNESCWEGDVLILQKNLLPSGPGPRTTVEEPKSCWVDLPPLYLVRDILTHNEMLQLVERERSSKLEKNGGARTSRENQRKRQLSPQDIGQAKRKRVGSEFAEKQEARMTQGKNVHGVRPLMTYADAVRVSENRDMEGNSGKMDSSEDTVNACKGNQGTALAIPAAAVEERSETGQKTSRTQRIGSIGLSKNNHRGIDVAGQEGKEASSTKQSKVVSLPEVKQGGITLPESGADFKDVTGIKAAAIASKPALVAEPPAEVGTLAKVDTNESQFLKAEGGDGEGTEASLSSSSSSKSAVLAAPSSKDGVSTSGSSSSSSSSSTSGSSSCDSESGSSSSSSDSDSSSDSSSSDSESDDDSKEDEAKPDSKGSSQTSKPRQPTPAKEPQRMSVQRQEISSSASELPTKQYNGPAQALSTQDQQRGKESDSSDEEDNDEDEEPSKELQIDFSQESLDSMFQDSSADSSNTDHRLPTPGGSASGTKEKLKPFSTPFKKASMSLMPFSFQEPDEETQRPSTAKAMLGKNLVGNSNTGRMAEVKVVNDLLQIDADAVRQGDKAVVNGKSMIPKSRPGGKRPVRVTTGRQLKKSQHDARRKASPRTPKFVKLEGNQTATSPSKKAQKPKRKSPGSLNNQSDKKNVLAGNKPIPRLLTDHSQDGMRTQPTESERGRTPPSKHSKEPPSPSKKLGTAVIKEGKSPAPSTGSQLAAFDGKPSSMKKKSAPKPTAEV